MTTGIARSADRIHRPPATIALALLVVLSSAAGGCRWAEGDADPGRPAPVMAGMTGTAPTCIPHTLTNRAVFDELRGAYRPAQWTLAGVELSPCIRFDQNVEVRARWQRLDPHRPHVMWFVGTAVAVAARTGALRELDASGMTVRLDRQAAELERVMSAAAGKPKVQTFLERASATLQVEIEHFREPGRAVAHVEIRLKGRVDRLELRWASDLAWIERYVLSRAGLDPSFDEAMHFATMLERTELPPSCRIITLHGRRVTAPGDELPDWHIEARLGGDDCPSDSLDHVTPQLGPSALR